MTRARTRNDESQEPLRNPGSNGINRAIVTVTVAAAVATTGLTVALAQTAAETTETRLECQAGRRQRRLRQWA